jgi:hypothetical protein
MSEKRDSHQLVERLVHGHLVSVKVFPPSVQSELDADAAADDYADADEAMEQERLTWC